MHGNVLNLLIRSLRIWLFFYKVQIARIYKNQYLVLCLINFSHQNLLQQFSFDDQSFFVEIRLKFIRFIIFFNSRIMRAQRQSFLHEFVIPSEKVCDVSQKIGFYRFYPEKKDIIYFKRKQIQNFEGIDPQVIQKSITNTIKSYDQELQMSQKKISKYILRYSSVIVSYPYACFLHQPYQEMLINFIKRKLSISAKISLMEAIAKGVNDLHTKEICVRTLRPSTIVMLQSTNQHFQIAFAQLTDIYQNVSQIREDKSWKLKLDPYNPPELLLGQEYTNLSDIWSLGMLFYQIWFDKKLAKSHHELDSNNIFKTNAPSWVINFLSKMICPNPKQRYNIKDILRLIKNAKLCSEVLCRKM